MTPVDNTVSEPPPGGAAISLEVAAWHLQTLLSAISQSDGKVMFLTALNAAGMSALIGVTVAADPSDWLLGAGLVLSSLCLVIGLGRLWAAEVRQFPSPSEALSYARVAAADGSNLEWRHFFAVEAAIDEAEASHRRSLQILRSLLLMTPASLSVVLATAVSTIS